ncbi:NAD(P)H-binding protein [Herbaspirillum sp.]|uniref:NmrA family NAD(P)-binding protein n=1 Tax=Herbaspirillum sp. TaxID=1890675 RepID=UPI001B2DA600|nr:NAD(P)H-binding protein [Herbaspirillum sp.]MBO9537048.1 NAD(P)H-binding protein [Herbaspirillum sp.]
MYVIFGAAGNVGHSAAQALRAAGHAVRAVVRSPAQGETLARMGCQIALADLDDEASVRRALDGAQAVQMLCPVAHRADDPAAAMLRMIGNAARALRSCPQAHVLAVSDYGAELDAGTGITLLYRELEARFKEAVPRLTLLRSAEHMQNWGRVLPVAMASGHLPTLHYPLDKKFPTVSAPDVGTAAAQLLLEGHDGKGVRVVSVEGPQRYDVNDVTRMLGEVCGRDIGAYAVPRDDWPAVLLRSGMSRKLADLIIETNDAQNDGRIDAQPGTERRFGTTGLDEVLAALVSAAGAR